MANKDYTIGTFLELASDGHINRITWHPDGSEDVFEVTDEYKMMS